MLYLILWPFTMAAPFYYESAPSELLPVYKLGGLEHTRWVNYGGVVLTPPSPHLIIIIIPSAGLMFQI